MGAFGDVLPATALPAAQLQGGHVEGSGGYAHPGDMEASSLELAAITNGPRLQDCNQALQIATDLS